jgi:hypothetical protein
MTHLVNLGLSRGLGIASTTKSTVCDTFRHAGKILVVLLLFSATPALAIQHGGGGGGHSSGGGGGHFGGSGGGHVGGGHPVSSARPSGGGQHASAPHPTSAPAPHSGTTAVGTGHPVPAPGAHAAVPATHVAEPGYIWEASPYHSNRVGPEAPQTLGKRGFLWEDPGLVGAGINSRPVFGPTAPSSGARISRTGAISTTTPNAFTVRRGNGTIAMRTQPARQIRGRRRFPFSNPFFFGGFYPFGFYPGFYFDNCFDFGFDYGYMFGYNPCGFGYLGPWGYGAYSGYDFGTSNYVGMQNQMPGFNGPSAPSEEPTSDEAVAPQGAEAPAPAPGVTVLYLKDGTSFGVIDYWLEGGRLHYVTTYGGANAMDMDELDTQHTVDENAKQGVSFTLRPPHTQDQEAQPPAQPKP